ncbi:hypothetical protein NHX12_020681, partial [Muraenolepis orangiensis]
LTPHSRVGRRLLSAWLRQPRGFVSRVASSAAWLRQPRGFVSRVASSAWLRQLPPF